MWAVAHDIAPTAGMIHYHLYIELFEAWKIADARAKFTVIDDKEIKIVPNIKTGAGTNEAISYIAKKMFIKPIWICIMRLKPERCTSS